MDITVTGRHIEATPAIKDYAAKKLEHIGIDFPRILSAHFILDVEKFRHIAELAIECGNHLTIEAREIRDRKTTRRCSGLPIAQNVPPILSAHFILDLEFSQPVAVLVIQCGNHITIETREI